MSGTGVNGAETRAGSGDAASRAVATGVSGASGAGTGSTGLLGLVTIGQSPRTDVLADLAPLLAGRAFVEHGALDDLDEHDSEAFAVVAPESDETPLVSRLRTGASVQIGHRALLPRLEAAIERCAADGADAVLLMCTGHFEPVPARIPVYDAESLAQASVVEQVGDTAFGVLTPVAGQVEESRDRWAARMGRAVDVAPCNPYSATPADVASAAVALVAASADQAPRLAWIVLDCFGYTAEQAAAVAQATGCAVLLTRTEAARRALTLIDDRA
jgi:protein AroM